MESNNDIKKIILKNQIIQLKLYISFYSMKYRLKIFEIKKFQDFMDLNKNYFAYV